MKKIKQLAEKHDIKFGSCREGFELNSAICDGSWTIKEKLKNKNLKSIPTAQ